MPSEKSYKENAPHRGLSHSSRSASNAVNAMAYGKITGTGPDHIQNNGYGNAVMQSMSASPGIQLKKEEDENIQLKENEAKENNTGLPDDLKSGVENLSGISMNDVKVHYNSDKPEQLQAQAYAQGTDIHVASGQEKHLPHEAWHVVQQKQGRVQPTLQMKEKVSINDDEGLEHEADVMGEKALKVSGSAQPPVQKKEARSNVAQRNKKSTKVLEDENMAEPKVGKQDIELAKNIHEDLEAIFEDVMEIDKKNMMEKTQYNSGVCLGGIILPPLQRFKSLKHLISCCRLENLGNGSVRRGIYELLNNDLKKKIIVNTLTTMDQANQLEYLKESNFGSKAKYGWKVVVEVQYYRTRTSTNNYFHKDTLGTTLFVNLNYMNKKKMIGPEYLVNPMESKEHLANIAKSLPKEFLKDKKTVMSQLAQPQIIEVVEIPEYGFVAFVDEMINHSSPTTEHRKVKGSAIHAFLRDRDVDKYREYKTAYDKWSKRWINWSYESYLPDGEGFDGQDWLSVLKKIENPNAKYDRNELRSMDPEGRVLSDEEIEKLIHIAGHDNFGIVSIPKNMEETKMTSNDRPLKRRMSMKLDQEKDKDHSSEKEVDGKRSFLRTWVRAEKVDNDVLKSDWKWTQQGGIG
ncbi:oxidoreductase, aldo/keto reductase family [Sporocytophaga myxococcoides]|uniref:Oxidoreductase, aldo/keto reductase family n=1 Tax=Sporocytophaga myxococcoides TaxID=153721 RepID=A0A098LMZ4_9BACT|nr:DUF4157 domain-containing protein [Sporocytophaga myxococcoides]GAL87493.1 oxidoreductase, aldo/keto reductase family [Sporocytophaga myxococcoides]